jgi:hypothetical protein
VHHQLVDLEAPDPGAANDQATDRERANGEGSQRDGADRRSAKRK